MDKQDTLLYVEPEKGNKESQRPLIEVVNRFESGILRIPEFQREFVWNDRQIKDWINSIINMLSVGVIVTYQLKGGGPTYLADGLQRLTATRKFIEDPQRYGCKFDSAQAKAFCDALDVTVQHRVYSNNANALMAFQRLNSGTALTPYEFYQGFLTLSEQGKIVAKRIPEVVAIRESHLVENQRKQKKSGQHKSMRDSYALFLQYLSKTELLTFWNVSSNSVTTYDTSAVEIELSDLVSRISVSDLNKLIDAFDRYISGEIALIDDINTRLGGRGKAIGYSSMRWFLHLALWKKNTGKTQKDYEDFITSLIQHCIKDSGFITSRIGWIDKRTNLNKYVTLSMNALTHLKELCEAFDSDLYQGKTRKKHYRTTPGYQASHIVPFSIHGEGEVFAEPSGRNIARGAKQVEGRFINSQ